VKGAIQLRELAASPILLLKLKLPLVVLFAMIYKILPDAKIVWGDVWIGAGIAAVLFEIGKFLLGFYLGKTGLTSAYGAAGSLVSILTWVFYSAQILFLGAEFSQVYQKSYAKEVIAASSAQPPA